MSQTRKFASQGQSAWRERASEVAGRVQELGEAAAGMASDYFRQGRNVVRHSARNVEHYVEEQPIRSALVALGIGCLIAAVFIRR